MKYFWGWAQHESQQLEELTLQGADLHDVAKAGVLELSKAASLARDPCVLFWEIRLQQSRKPVLAQKHDMLHPDHLTLHLCQPQRAV